MPMTQWQDMVLAICVFAFNIALIPSLLGADKPRVTTSLMTFIFLLPQAYVFLTLSLWYSFIMSAANATLWLILVIQKTRQNSN